MNDENRSQQFDNAWERSLSKANKLKKKSEVKLLKLATLSRKNFHGFSSVTGINGFAFILDANYWFEKAFWTVMLCICAAMTIHDVVITFETFLSESKNSQVSVVSADSLDIANATICLPVDTRRLATRAKLSNSSAVAWALRAYESQFDQLLSGQVDGNYSGFGSRSGTGSGLATALYLTANLLSEMSDEMVNSESSSDEAIQLLLNADSNTDSSMQQPDVSNSLRMVYDFLLQKGAKFDELVQTVGILICKLAGLRLSVSRQRSSSASASANSHELSVCTRDSISYFGTNPFGSRDQLCFVMSDEQIFSFRTILDEFLLVVDLQHLYSKREHNSNNAQDLRLYIDLDGRNVLTLSSQNVLVVPNGSSKVDVEMVSHSFSLSTQHDPCSLSESLQDCQAMCRATYFYERQGCWSLRYFALPSRPPQAPFCFNEAPRSSNSIASQSYNNSGGRENLTELVFESTTDCSQFCYRSCETKMFSYTVTPSDYHYRSTQLSETSVDEQQHESSKAKGGATHVQLRARRFTRLHIEESLAMDLHSMLITIGGNLGGSWLGISAIALIHVPVFIIRMLLHQKKKKESDAHHQHAVTAPDKGVSYISDREFSMLNPIRPGLYTSEVTKESHVSLPVLYPLTDITEEDEEDEKNVNPVRNIYNPYIANKLPSNEERLNPVRTDIYHPYGRELLRSLSKGVKAEPRQKQDEAETSENIKNALDSLLFSDRYRDLLDNLVKQRIAEAKTQSYAIPERKELFQGSS